MKLYRLPNRLVLACSVLVLPLVTTSGVTFNSNTMISPDNTNFDGQDVVVTNCTVTIDGPHSFASFLVQNGGVLTHSFSAGGSLTDSGTVSNELHELDSTNAVPLNDTGVVDGSVVVTDTSGLVTFTNGVDYVLSGAGVITIQRTDTSAIPDGASVLVSYATSNSIPTGLFLTIGGDFSVNLGGAVDADALGYGSGHGLGSGRGSSGVAPDGSGGGYGGYGGMSSSNAPGGTAYGSSSELPDKGSGGGSGLGGPGGNGGGLISLNVGGKLRVDGVISADGQDATNSRSGGGSGGGIYLTAPSLSGSGWISSDGGGGSGGGFGGGGGGGF